MADCELGTFDNGNCDFTQIPSGFSEVTEEVSLEVQGWDHTAIVSQTQNDINKYVVRYTLKEMNTETNRLKGFTESAAWTQGIGVSMDITEDQNRNNGINP